ncbi:unnamed protein product [Rotaria sp. Silwood1]|nr:unnamed protein product [Rotaria sp. Silwood1]
MIADRSMVGDSNFCRCFTLTIVLSTSVSSSTLQSWSLIRNEIAIEVRIDRFNKLTCFNVIGDLERCNGFIPSFFYQHRALNVENVYKNYELSYDTCI